MPWKSDQQRKWGHTAAGKKALGGEAAVEEWDAATKGKKLPKKVEKAEMKKFGGMMQLGLSEKNVKSPIHTGTHDTSIREPRPKKLPGPEDKPSVFFKGEKYDIKHPNIQKLYDLWNRSRMRKCSQS